MIRCNSPVTEIANWDTENKIEITCSSKGIVNMYKRIIKVTLKGISHNSYLTKIVIIIFTDNQPQYHVQAEHIICTGIQLNK